MLPASNLYYTLKSCLTQWNSAPVGATKSVDIPERVFQIQTGVAKDTDETTRGYEKLTFHDDCLLSVRQGANEMAIKPLPDRLATKKQTALRISIDTSTSK